MGFIHKEENLNTGFQTTPVGTAGCRGKRLPFEFKATCEHKGEKGG